MSGGTADLDWLRAVPRSERPWPYRYRRRFPNSSISNDLNWRFGCWAYRYWYLYLAGCLAAGAIIGFLGGSGKPVIVGIAQTVGAGGFLFLFHMAPMRTFVRRHQGG